MECMKSELDLFVNKPLQTNILKTEEVAYKPVSSLDNTSDIEFVSVGHGNTYRDPSSIYLQLRVQLLKNLQGELHTDAKSTVVNNILHSLFKQCSVYLNNTPVAQNSNNHNYRCYIENLLNFGSETASTHLDGAGWTIDSKPMDYVAPTVVGGGPNPPPTPPVGSTATTEKNNGLETRREMFGNSNVVELMGRIHADVLNQSKLLLNNVDLRVVLSLEKPEFYVLEEDTGTSYMKILDATMYMNHATINPSVLIAHEMALQKMNAQYPFNRVEVKSYTVSANSHTLSLDNVVIGPLPNLLLFAMVDNDAYSGKRSKNPFDFKHNDISQFNLNVNGMPVPCKTLTFDYDKKPPSSARGYNTLFKGTNIRHFDKSHQITKKFFDNGCFLLAFELTADHANNMICGNLLNQGTIGIEARFKKALTNTITCIVYAEYDGCIEVNRDRYVSTAY